MSDHPANQPLPVAAAAEAAGVPRRTLYRAVTRGDVSSTKVGRGLVVDLEAVRAWAAARADDRGEEDAEMEGAEAASVPPPATAPGATVAIAPEPSPAPTGLAVPGTEAPCAVAHEVGGTPLGTDPGTVPECSVDARVNQRVYGLFAAGLGPRDVVIREGLHPDVVDAVKAAWDRQGGPSDVGSAVLDDLRLTLRALDDQVVAAQVAAADAAQDASDAVGLSQSVAQRLAQVEALVAQQAAALFALGRRLDAHALADLER